MKLSAKVLFLAVLSTSTLAVSAAPATVTETPVTAQPDLSTALNNNIELMPMVWLGGSDSSVYGFVAHTQYANYLSPQDAVSFLLDYGSEQFRMDLTWAHVINEKQRFKISLQHFSQDNTFDFDTGPDHQFIGQNDVGFAYEYAVPRRFLQAFHINGYYFGANNGDFGPTTLITPGGAYQDNRNLVGATGGGLGLGPRWKLWTGSEVELTFGYDTVNFDTQSEPAKNSSGFGQNVYFTQQLTKNIDLQLMVVHRQPYHQYAANLDWAFYQKQGRRLGLQLQASHLNSDVLPASNENIIGLNLFYQWDGNATKGKALCFKGDTSCDLLNWSSRSAAYLPGVFVQRDQSIVLK